MHAKFDEVARVALPSAGARLDHVYLVTGKKKRRHRMTHSSSSSSSSSRPSRIVCCLVTRKWHVAQSARQLASRSS